LPASFAVIGWSMGGMFATRLAIEEPHRVTHLVNIASSPRFIADGDWPGVDREIFATFYDGLVTDPEKTLSQFIQLQRQGHLSSYAVAHRRPSLVGLREGLDILVNWDLRQPLYELRQPVCYMFGRLDTITSRQILPTMQTSYPAFEYVLFPKAAHMPFLSHQQQFITALEGFLQ